MTCCAEHPGRCLGTGRGGGRALVAGLGVFALVVEVIRAIGSSEGWQGVLDVRLIGPRHFG